MNQIQTAKRPTYVIVVASSENCPHNTQKEKTTMHVPDQIVQGNQPGVWPYDASEQDYNAEVAVPSF